MEIDSDLDRVARGERFVSEVEKPDHPFHKAWLELSKPGFKRGWFVDSTDIKTLLEGIRQDFPEVENRLDPQRVGAWEQKIYPADMLAARGYIGAGSGISFGAALLWFAFRYAGILMHMHAATPAPAGVPPAAIASADPAVAALDQAAVQWFGPGVGIAEVSRRAPLVGRLVAAYANTDPASPDAAHAMRDAVFRALHLAALRGDSQTLRAVERLRLDVLGRVPPQDGDGCMMMLQEDHLPGDLKLLPAEQAQASKLLSALSTAGKLPADLQQVAAKTAIPGTIIHDIMVSGHLSETDVRTALQHDGPFATQCAVGRMLIARALRLPANAGDPILRVE